MKGREESKENMKNTREKITKHKSGITLIALVVTIVVLLILAGVSINLVLGNNGIIAKAKEAETKSAEASQNDLKGMNALAEEMNNALGEKSKVDSSKYKIGDYVNYTYDTAENYVLTSATCGSSSNPTDGIPQTSGLKWRILNIDEANGTVDLISENPTGTEVYFSNILGYNNGPYLMNEICKAQYSNKSLGVNARSINILDMEKHLTPTGITNRNAYKSLVKYGTTKTYTSNTKYPSLYAGQKGAGVNVAEKNASTIAQPDITKGNDPYEESKPIATTEPTTDNTSGTGNPLTVTQTYYSIPINEANYGEAYNVLNNSTAYWVASRFVDTDSGNAYFGLRIANTDADGLIMFFSNGITSNNGIRLRPVVSLSSSILSETKDASGAWNLK